MVDGTLSGLDLIKGYVINNVTKLLSGLHSLIKKEVTILKLLSENRNMNVMQLPGSKFHNLIWPVTF